MEKNMLVLQSDLKSLTFKSVPYQETAMQVSGGTLMIKKDVGSVPNFTIVGADSSPLVYYPGELRFISSNGDATISLENGGVHIRYWSSPGSAMIANPSWYYDPLTETYVIQFIRINGTSDFTQTGIGNIRMQLSNPPKQKEFNITNKNVSVTYNHDVEWDYQTAWKNYLTMSDLKMTDTGSSKYTFYPAKKLVIKTYNVTFLSL
jgi:hypothetical protein